MSRCLARERQVSIPTSGEPDGGGGPGLPTAKSFIQVCGGELTIGTGSDHVFEHEDEVTDASRHDEQVENLMGSEVFVPGVEERQF